MDFQARSAARGRGQADHDEILIVPGFHGSGPAHWQSWMAAVLPGARRLTGIDWESPVLHEWSARIADEIDRAERPLWIVAHSFGCLATVAALPDREARVRGVMLVAPADPERFTAGGCRDSAANRALPGIAADLPQSRLDLPALVVASSNDPWVSIDVAQRWSARWGGRLINVGAAGHINVDAGFGPWPAGIEMLDQLRGETPARLSGGFARPGIATLSRLSTTVQSA